MSKSRPGGISQHCPQLQREWRTTDWERPSLRPLLAWWPRIRCSLLQLAQIWSQKRNNWCFMVINGWQEVKLKHCTVLSNWSQVARSRAEEQVKALEVTDEFGLHLAELTLQVFFQLNPLPRFSWTLGKQFVFVTVQPGQTDYCQNLFCSERWCPPSKTVGLSPLETVHRRPLEPRCSQVPTL